MAEDEGSGWPSAPSGRSAPERGGEPGDGQGGPGHGAPGQPRHLRAVAGPTRPGRAARGAGHDQGAGAGPHPLRPDAGLALHLLPRRRPGHGVGPLDHADARASRPRSAGTPTSRTSASSARPSASSSSTATTSTRRSPGPGSGTSSAWRRASWSPAATRATPSRCGPAAIVALGRSTGSRCARWPTMSNLEVWYFHVDVAEVITDLAVPGGRLGLEGAVAHGGHGDQGDRQGTDQGQHEGARQVDARGRRPAPHHQRSPAPRARSKSSSPRSRPNSSSPCSARSCAATARPVDRPPPPAGGVPLQPDGPQGRRGGQRRHPGLGHPHARAPATTTSCSCRRRRPRPRSSSASPRRASTATTAPGWWPASA